MNSLEANRIVVRVINEVAGTAQTNGIRELGSIYNCLVSTAYNAVRSLPGFSYSYNEFFEAVEQQIPKDRTASNRVDPNVNEEPEGARACAVEQYWKDKQGDEYGSY